MKVKELMERLGQLPEDADVKIIYDGEPRSNVEKVWISRSGKCMLADSHDVVYSTDARPESAPTRGELHWWKAGQYDE